MIPASDLPWLCCGVRVPVCVTAASWALDFGTFFSRYRIGVGKASVPQGLRLDVHSVPGPGRAPLLWRSQPSFPQLSREQECARVCLAGPVRGRSSRAKDSSLSLPHLLPGSLLGAGKGDRAGDGWVRRLCLCKSACWCIYGPLFFVTVGLNFLWLPCVWVSVFTSAQ